MLMSNQRNSRFEAELQARRGEGRLFERHFAVTRITPAPSSTVQSRPSGSLRQLHFGRPKRNRRGRDGRRRPGAIIGNRTATISAQLRKCGLGHIGSAVLQVILAIRVWRRAVLARLIASFTACLLAASDAAQDACGRIDHAPDLAESNADAVGRNGDELKSAFDAVIRNIAKR